MVEIEGLICYLCSLSANYTLAKTGALGKNLIIQPLYMGKQLADYYSHVFSLIHLLQLDEFSFKEMKT